MDRRFSVVLLDRKDGVDVVLELVEIQTTGTDEISLKLELSEGLVW